MTKLTIDAARTIIREALAKSHEMGLKPMSVIVLDAGGTRSPSNARTARHRAAMPLPRARLTAP